MHHQWLVHKFGGSSLASAEKFRQVKPLVSGNYQAIVVSAIQGVTSALEHCVNSAMEKKYYKTDLHKIKQRHLEIIEELLPVTAQTSLKAMLQIDINQIEDLLYAVHLFGLSNSETYDIVMGFGERWSAQILAEYLSLSEPTAYIDAGECIFVNKSDSLEVLWNQSKAQLNDCLSDSKRCVMTGFIASTSDGKRTTLGRNGSDYSASILSKLIEAKHLTIWTDVDGVMSADPRIVPSAFVLEKLSYEEAFELAYFGASVVHPNTMAPVTEKRIPISIKNSYNPEAKGTLISQDSSSEHLIKGISSINNISMISVEGSGMMGVSGVAARVFQTTQQQNVSVVLISQASSEHSICFAVKHADSEKTMAALRDQFYLELEKNQIQNISCDSKCSIVAIVGDNMIGRFGIMEKVSHSLAKSSVNIIAIAQGSSERNISIVVSEKDVARAVKSIHSGFHLSKRTLSIGLIGHGLIGSTLLDQFNAEKQNLLDSFNIDLRVRGIMDSKKMYLEQDQINLKKWESEFDLYAETTNLNTFVKHIKSDEFPHSVVIDCTASQSIADQYLNFLDQNLHIITPNKKANSSSLAFYNSLQKKLNDGQNFFFYETTVGAGLPIIKTLDDLIQTGDKIVEIEGIFSGTLAYLFDQFEGTTPFSEIVIQAKEKGFTEPDPRDDLSGMDVARKVVTLARQMGLKSSLEEINVESLVPKELEDCTLDEFLEKLPNYDNEMAEKIQNAQKANASLRYVGYIKHSGEIGVELKQYDTSHPFGRLQGSDNIVLFKTKRYFSQPLMVQGPGAGAEVTAAGVFADLLRLAASID